MKTFKRNIKIGILWLIGTGCGAGTGNPASHNSYAVTTAADLPTCDTTRSGQLYYVETDSNFQVCKTEGWTVVAIKGADGASGAITSNKVIDSVAADLCTEVTGEDCYFRGGQIVTLADGTKIITAGFRYGYLVSGDTDLDEKTTIGIVPPTTSTASGLLSIFVPRGAGYKSLYLVYSRTGDELTLVHDTNGDFIPNAGDTTLATLTTSNW